MKRIGALVLGGLLAFAPESAFARSHHKSSRSRDEGRAEHTRTWNGPASRVFAMVRLPGAYRTPRSGHRAEANSARTQAWRSGREAEGGGLEIRTRRVGQSARE
jgi:hypothetical protein